MPSSAARRIRRIRPSFRAAAMVCAAALLCVGCSGAAATTAPETGSAAPSASPSAAGSGTPPATAPGTSLEAIASAIGCTAQVNVEAEELREGGCQAGQAAYRMVTFAAAGGLRSWLDEARAYGGVYLVGDRWVVTTQSKEALEALRGRIGGTVEAGDTHGAPAGQGGGGEHSGAGEHAGHPSPASSAPTG
ncbi:MULTISPECIES: hypothetical protein [unclassified Streptomyces]|uniref:hypothetical protein n=1 Tax=unclassified Streptomyces TaxID=2593676 RepID=UPI00343FD882